MFPSMTDSRPNKRSLRELMRGAMDTALELVTLGEATALTRQPAPPAPAPTPEHPHRRRQLGHHRRKRRPGMVAPRPQVCTTPVHRPVQRA
jgi:hypothetical protein